MNLAEHKKVKELEAQNHKLRAELAAMRYAQAEAASAAQHWQRVAMQEAGFDEKVISAVMAKPKLTTNELDTLRRMAADWAQKRGLTLSES